MRQHASADCPQRADWGFSWRRYETLAVATDADTRQEGEQQSKSAGKRLQVSWR